MRNHYSPHVSSKTKALMKERNALKKDFGEQMDLSSTWRKARVILGQNNNLAPTAIKTTSDKGDVEIVTNPKRLANLFNNFTE